MFTNIKEYIKYKKNKKIVKRELYKMASTTLPSVSNVAENSSEIMGFLVDIAKESKDIGGEKLVQMVLDKIAILLETNNDRLLTILTYIANLSPNDIHKILVHSMVDTMTDDENNV